MASLEAMVFTDNDKSEMKNLNTHFALFHNEMFENDGLWMFGDSEYKIFEVVNEIALNLTNEIITELFSISRTEVLRDGIDYFQIVNIYSLFD